MKMEIRKKISKTLTGHKLTKETKRKISQTLIGRKLPAETKRKMSVAARKRLTNPENNPNWKGGLSFEIYSYEYRQIREKIRERDNRICQLCGKTEKQNRRKLDVHHIDYDKMNSEPKNLISLCHICNAKANSDREAWTRIFQNMIGAIE